MDVRSPLSPHVAAHLHQLVRSRVHLEPDELVGLARAVVATPDLWRPLVRHDPVARWYGCLHRDDRVEVWLLGWHVAQETAIHDHGGSSGAFVVAAGSLAELHTTRDRRGPLRRRVHRAGQGAAFGPAYVHDLGNPGPAVASSVHVYSPPLQAMTYYELVAGVPVATVLA